MMYFVVLFVPPLYFAIRKKWGAFLINGFFYLCSFPLLIFWGFGAIIWALCVGHAGWHLRKELMEEHAQMIATKMVEKMSQSNPKPAPVLNPKTEQPVLSVNTAFQQRNVAQTDGGFCPSCGGKNPSTSNFCGHCGARL